MFSFTRMLKYTSEIAICCEKGRILVKNLLKMDLSLYTFSIRVKLLISLIDLLINYVHTHTYVRNIEQFS